MEKKGILGNTTARRHGDVTFPLWAEGKALVIDVAETSPLTERWWSPVSGMLQLKNMGNMMWVSKAPSILSVL